MYKKILVVLLIGLMLSSGVFALTPKEKALNYLFGNPLRLPIIEGSDIIITKANPVDSFWYICKPVLNCSNPYTHKCSMLGGNN